MYVCVYVCKCVCMRLSSLTLFMRAHLTLRGFDSFKKLIFELSSPLLIPYSCIRYIYIHMYVYMQMIVHACVWSHPI